MANPKSFDMIEVIKLVGIIGAAVGGSTAISSSATPSNERVAVLEVKVESLEASSKKILDGQETVARKVDSLIIELRDRK